MNKQAGKIILEKRNKLGYTQAAMAEKLAKALNQTYSQRQYQKLEEGNFPKFKKTIVTELDKILGTNILDMVYEQNVLNSKLEFNEGDSDYGKSDVEKQFLKKRIEDLERIINLQERIIGKKNTG